MKFKHSELVKLSKGDSPCSINKNWDSEKVVAALSKMILENLSRKELLRIMGGVYNDTPIKKGERKCSKCYEIKPISEFHKAGDGHKPYCKKCRNKYNREMYKNNKEYWKEYYSEKQLPRYLKENWGISVDDYKNILKEQDYRCPNCGDEICEIGKDKRLYWINERLQIWCMKCYVITTGKNFGEE